MSISGKQWKISPLMSQKGSVLIYAMILAFFGTIAAVLLYTKSETLITQSALSTIEMKSSKNLTARADLAIKFATAVNSDGGGFRDTLLCPSLVTLTNTSSGTIVFATGSTPEYGYQGVSCIARDSQYGESVLSYTASGSAFSGTNFYGLSLPLSQNGGNIETPIFTGSGGFSYRLSFPVVSAYSGLDLDGDSDDLRPSSTGSVVYPGGKVDNDSLGRQVIYGYIKRGVGESLVFWNNDRMARSISANPNNTGSLALLWATATGYLYLDTDGPYNIRVVEFDRTKYNTNRELFPVSSTGTLSSTGWVGYLQPSLALSWVYGTGSIGARAFDFTTRDYAIFLSYPGEASGTGADFLRYQLKVTNASGSGVAIVPLQDSISGEMKILADDILRMPDGKWVARQEEVTRSITR